VELQCLKCGESRDVSCSCGQPYVSKGERAEWAVKAHPGWSDRRIAAEIGVDGKTIAAARKKLFLGRVPLNDDEAATLARAEESAGEGAEDSTGYSPRRLGRDGKTYSIQFKQEPDVRPVCVLDDKDKQLRRLHEKAVTNYLATTTEGVPEVKAVLTQLIARPTITRSGSKLSLLTILKLTKRRTASWMRRMGDGRPARINPG